MLEFNESLKENQKKKTTQLRSFHPGQENTINPIIEIAIWQQHLRVSSVRIQPVEEVHKLIQKLFLEFM